MCVCGEFFQGFKSVLIMLLRIFFSKGVGGFHSIFCLILVGFLFCSSSFVVGLSFGARLVVHLVSSKENWDLYSNYNGIGFRFSVRKYAVMLLNIRVERFCFCCFPFAVVPYWARRGGADWIFIKQLHDSINVFQVSYIWKWTLYFQLFF